jgi:hypothetical protein
VNAVATRPLSIHSVWIAACDACGKLGQCPDPKLRKRQTYHYVTIPPRPGKEHCGYFVSNPRRYPNPDTPNADEPVDFQNTTGWIAECNHCGKLGKYQPPGVEKGKRPFRHYASMINGKQKKCGAFTFHPRELPKGINITTLFSSMPSPVPPGPASTTKSSSEGKLRDTAKFFCSTERSVFHSI